MPDKPEDDVATRAENRLLSEKQLQQWLIPDEYWHELLRLETEEQLLDLQIPDIYLARILDYFYPTALESLQNQPEFKLEADLVKFAKITGFLLHIELMNSTFREENC
ncbi:MAG: hypothetical protein DSM107014_12105 [Gomphosphaeria aponina SAG 52.96 = DSM 107014]|uniref:Uncharacterized protein n=1 Tax=Gomphosphaeria aponina SAG 52.96 = DSM 107014 TaxID=1521640 RepID=A0A941GX54_9CHRO|nr:hypothetical protein [Gomphosphaeria aponina SAG 52.96 = DSM 107014]